MNASSMTKKYRRRKQANKEDTNGRGRSLGDLPDDVLSHILSFLPTKEAVRTSILSKRWEYIWTSIPKLKFIQGDAEPTNFVNIIERALRLRRSSNITNFSLQCRHDTSSHVQEWISALVKYDVQDLDLKLDSAPEPLTLPLSFVNCGTLTNFTLNMIGSELLEFPSSICFSNLKKLELQFVTFSSEHSTQQLFSGCPILEDLKLDRCNWTHVKSVGVAAPRLEYFTMIEVHESVGGYVFVIVGGCLKSFHYEGGFYFNYNIWNSKHLEDVYINYYSHKNSLRFLALLRCISNVPKLTLRNASLLLDIPELVIHIPELAIHIPMFTGVQYLGLDYQSSDLSNVGFLKMLQNFPCLESLFFYEGIKMSNRIENGILDPLPPCFLNHLHFVAVRIVLGDVEELLGVLVLLQNAMVLEEMAIEFSTLVNEDKRNRICREFLKFRRASKDCGIFIGE